jgi:carbon monoxide dehydrogenase subunit G
MEFTESYTLPVPQQQTWEALNDTAVLRASIPGCDSIEAEGDNAYALSMSASVGPVKARFKGRMRLTDIDAPHTYTIVFEGQGGTAGFGKGTANVTLEPYGDAATKLSYTAHAQVGGKLAQIASRLVDGAARKIAGEFFKRFSAQMTGEDLPAAVADADAEPLASDAADAPQPPEHSVQTAAVAECAPTGKGQKSWKAWISKF